ncbi:ankyrin repeat-containing domain protein [Trichoderma evansii]
MLDQIHTTLSLVNDDNAYTLGSIGAHNVVIACLPKGRYGTNSAATIAIKMISSFPAIKFGLLVGIGGGIPSKVRLGDVVVSAPIDQYPGVVQWDLGKAEGDGGFRRTGALNSPPNALLKVLTKLESEHEMQEPKILRFLDEMRRKWPRLYPKYFWNDSLKDPQDRCIERGMKCPGIHHGLIASGNQVIKDATVRDRLDEHLNGNLLCLEMEAAGLMNDFPCLVIRGICDYADTTKNKDWQEYAAAVAAAYAKEIISGLQVCAVEHMDSVKDILSSINSELRSFRTAVNELTTRQYTRDHLNFLNSLAAVDYTLQQKDNFIQRQPGTGQWLLNSDTYRLWVDTNRQTLFCPGIPGAGKTILTSIIRLLQQITASYSRVFILLDALDECQESNGCRASFLEEIFLLQESAKVDIFATSRFIPEIMQTFEACKYMEIRATQQDLQRYVRSQLEEGGIEHLPSLVKNKPELEDAIIRGISNAVDGMFLLAKIFLDSFVDKITIADVKEAIAQLPTHIAGVREDQRLIILNQAYDSAWVRINEQKEGFRNIATRVLAWIACAKRPLSTKELQHALAVKVGMDELDEDNIPRIHDMSNVIRLAHYTTQEYFERKKNDWFSNAEAMIAETCISYLSVKTFGEYNSDDYTYDYQRSHAFYEFASHYWGDHARIAGRKLDKIILKFLTSGAKASNAFYAAERYFSLNCRNLFAPGKSGLQNLAPMSGMHLAVLFALDEAINLLLKNGYPINEKEGVAITPLLLALDLGHLRIAHTLLDNGDHIRFKSGYYGCKYVSAAMRPENYNQRFVKKLIAAGIAFGEDISWFLNPAVQYGHGAIVKLLLEIGADVNTKLGDLLGFTPLHNAISCENEAMVKLLLDEGANIEEASNFERASFEVSNRYGEKPLHCAVKKANVAIINSLLKQGANIEALDENGRTPLFSAAGFASGVLLKKGANIETVDSRGYTPLLLAAETGSEAVFYFLMKMGANVNAVTYQGKNPLHLRALSFEQNVIDSLFERGVNVEAADIEGSTPLLCAVDKYVQEKSRLGRAANGQDEIQLLLDKGANINAADNWRRTPLSYELIKRWNKSKGISDSSRREK